MSLKRFISNEQALSVKLSYKKKEVYEEIIALNSKMSLQSQTSRETDEIRKKIQDSSDSIQRLESILIETNKVNDQISKEISEIQDRINEFKKEITPGDLLLIDAQRGENPENSTAGDHSQQSAKSNNIESFIQTVKNQNIKLKAAIKRAKITKEIPCLASKKNVRATIMSKINDLTREIEEKEKMLHSFDRKELAETTKIVPVEINETVLSFIRMTDRIRDNKGMPDLESFFSALDETEKYIYDISQNRREFAKYLDL